MALNNKNGEDGKRNTEEEELDWLWCIWRLWIIRIGQVAYLFERKPSTVWIIIFILCSRMVSVTISPQRGQICPLSEMDSASSITPKTTPKLSKSAKPLFNYCQHRLINATSANSPTSRLASGSFYELGTLLYISITLGSSTCQGSKCSR